MSLDPTGKGRNRWTMRWKAALNAFAITFSDRFPAAELLTQPPETPLAKQTRFSSVTDCAGTRFRVWCLFIWRGWSRGGARGARVRTGSDCAGLCLLSR